MNGMKKIILIAFFSLIWVSYTTAQTKPKEKPQTQKEAEEKKNENQKKTFDEPTDEEIREMEKLGIKLPTAKDMPKMTDQQWQDAVDESERIVPKKDIARITSISKTPLTNTAMPAFLQSVHGQIITELDPYIIESGDKIYQWSKSENYSTTALGNLAVGFWMMGKPPVAVYLLSKACMDDPSDVDNLNNFSALLLMAGAEQLAIPMLNNLNIQFPKNSTILNNIGQAWFGLGDLDKAEKYLDSTIRIYTYHSQANLTKSLIEESKGDKVKAIESVKRSIKNSYSQEKESRLDKLGHKLMRDDLNWNRPMPQDPLGLEKFNWPAYPKSVEESEKLEIEWHAFREACSIKIAELSSQQGKLVEAMIAATKIRQQQLIQASHAGQHATLFPPLAYKAFTKLKYLVDGTDGQLAFSLQKKTSALTDASKNADENDDMLESKLAVIAENYKDEFGEGKSNPFEEACDDDMAVKNAFLSSSNAMLQDTATDYLNFLRRMLNDEVYYKQYTMWPEDFEVAKVNAKKIWLGAISSQKVMFKDLGAWCQSGGKVEQERFKLQEFDDVHCEYHSELSLGIGDITSNCGTLKAELNFKVLKNTLNIETIKLGWTFKQRDNPDATLIDQWERCNLEIGLKKGFGVGTGPLKAEAKVGGSGFVEIDRNGLSDAGLMLSADVKIGTNFVKPLDGIKGIEVLDASGKVVRGLDGIAKEIDHSVGGVKDLSATIVGAEAKISISSGFTVEGKFLGKKIKK
jgi:tetratricopeptide (TPR) repeat protein